MKLRVSLLRGQAAIYTTVLLLLAAALFKPAIPMQRQIFNYIFVIDITQSMNARDYHVAGLPADRLSFVKQSLQHVLHELPCHSKVGLGLFTTKNMFLLFEPLEICQHYHVIETSLEKIDWRMAWAADSHIARGLYASIRDLGKVGSKPRLVFFTDGQQTPSGSKTPPFLSTPGAVKGQIIGVGNLQPVPIPKLDNSNRQIGYWLADEAETRSRRTAGRHMSTEKYLSSVKENELQRLAGITGLQYHHLQTPQQLADLLQAADIGNPESVDTDISWFLAATALLVFVTPYFRTIYGDR